MADPFRMIIFVVLIFGLVSVAKMYFASRRDAREAARPDDLMQRKITQLEERVRVLETIVTDQRHDLKREIDGL